MEKQFRLTKYQLFTEIIGGLLLLGFTVYLCFLWPTFSDIVPSHYAIDGTADAWSKKISSILLPILGWLIYICLTVLLFIPRMWKVPKYHHNPDKQINIYRVCRSLLCTINMGIAGMFVYVSVCTVHNDPLGVWFLPAIVVGSVLLNIIFLSKLPKLK
ncbi:MAG: DUF1648 domain-containing protein [Clostridiales bacterium]